MSESSGGRAGARGCRMLYSGETVTVRVVGSCSFLV